MSERQKLLDAARSAVNVLDAAQSAVDLLNDVLGKEEEDGCHGTLSEHGEQQCVVTDVKYRCNEGWWNFEDRCYRVLDNGYKSKQNATKICTTGKAKLFVPSSTEEYNAVTSYFTTSNDSNPSNITEFWVGCDDEEVEGIFKCTDGTTFDSSSGWWKGNEPNNIPTESDCVIYFQEGLDDKPCDDFSTHVLCEAPAAITRSSTYSSSSNRCLRGYTQKTVHRKSKTRCAAECLKEDYCVSFNFKDGVCDLNYKTRNQADYTEFQEEEGCSYFEP